MRFAKGRQEASAYRLKIKLIKTACVKLNVSFVVFQIVEKILDRFAARLAYAAEQLPNDFVTGIAI